jgi:hypothetical protein
MKRRQGRETFSFEEALAEEPRRIARGWNYGWYYAGLGRYKEQLERYYRTFSPSQIKIVLFDDLSRDPSSFMRELFRFLAVDDTFVPNLSTPRNTAFLARSPAIHRWFTSRSRLRDYGKRLLPAARPVWDRLSATTRRLNSTVPPPLDPAVRARLTRQWDDTIQSLQDFIGRDLSAWREV